jgi:hypothetical protein
MVSNGYVTITNIFVDMHFMFSCCDIIWCNEALLSDHKRTVVLVVELRDFPEGQVRGAGRKLLCWT